MRDGPDIQVKTAPVDQDELRAIIGDAVTEAEQNDPKRLRARIAELEKAGGGKIDGKALREAEEAAERRGKAQGYREAISALRGVSARLRESAKALIEIADGIPESIDRIEPTKPIARASQEVVRKPELVSAAPPADGITGPQQRILDAMALLQALGLDSLHKVQIPAIAGVSPSSGSFANNLGRLRTLGLIDYPQSGQVAFTAAGIKAARAPDAPPSVEDLHRAWLGLVTGPQARILERAIRVYPEAVSKEDRAQQVDVSASSGSYANNLGRLRTLGVIDYPSRGFVRANNLLFPVGKAA